MIRINLLPEKRSPKTAGVMQQFVVGAIAIALALIIGIGLVTTVSGEISEVEAETKKVEAKIAELKTIIGDLDQIKKQRDDLQSKLNIINDLNAKRTGPVKAMQDLSMAIPYSPAERLKKKMWIESLVESGETGDFKMGGFAFDNETIAQFMNGLNGMNTYCNVVFQDSKRIEKKGVKLYEFNLAGKFCDKAREQAASAARAAGPGAAPGRK